jgi:abortive infection bacteriophage resistance protein
LRDTFAIGKTFEIHAAHLDDYRANYKHMDEVLDCFLKNGEFELLSQKFLFDYSIEKKTHKSLIILRRL